MTCKIVSCMHTILYNTDPCIIKRLTIHSWTCLSYGYPETYNVVLMEMVDTQDSILCDCYIPLNSQNNFRMVYLFMDL